jgi:peptide/nickel transport system substrate-binding protein
MTRFVAVAAAVFLMFGLAGCTWGSKQDENSSLSSNPTEPDTSKTQQNKKTVQFALAYTGDDTLNPYKAKTLTNLNLSSLFFEGLVKIDDEMMPAPQLAASLEYPSKLTISAVLRLDAKFSDGSPVKVEDVLYSFSLAKSSGNYKALMSNVKSAKKDGENGVLFTLNSADPHAAACLSFPVLKKGTADQPVGSGLYIFKDGSLPQLIPNPNNPVKPKIKEIRLLDVPDGDAMIYALESGNISFYYNDLSGGSIPQITTASISVELNSLVFVGINSFKSGLSNPKVRSAINLSISRAEICANAFAGRARPAQTPFNPSWKAASGLKGFDEREKIDTAVAQLNEAGYNKGNSQKKLSLELLVGKENSFRVAAAGLLKNQLARAGVEIKITELPHTELIKRLKSGKFDLYIGEIRLSANMSLKPVLARDGSAAYGVNRSGEAAAAYSKYLNGEIDMQQFTDIFTKDVPFIPLCWRNGIAAYNRSLSKVAATAFCAYYGIENWTYQ